MSIKNKVALSVALVVAHAKSLFKPTCLHTHEDRFEAEYQCVRGGHTAACADIKAKRAETHRLIAELNKEQDRANDMYLAGREELKNKKVQFYTEQADNLRSDIDDTVLKLEALRAELGTIEDKLGAL